MEVKSWKKLSVMFFTKNVEMIDIEKIHFWTHEKPMKKLIHGMNGEYIVWEHKIFRVKIVWIFLFFVGLLHHPF